MNTNDGTCSASARRLGRLREAAGREGIRAFLVRDTSNITWLSAFDGVFDDEDAHALLVTPHDAVLHTDSRYSEAARAAAQASAAPADASPCHPEDSRAASPLRHPERSAKREAEGSRAAPAPCHPEDSRAAPAPCHPEDSRAAPASCHPEGSREAPAEEAPIQKPLLAIDDSRRSHARFVAETLAARRGAESAPCVLGIEDSLSLGEFRALEAALAEAPGHGPELRETSRFVLDLRAVKEPAEIARLRAAQVVTDAAFSHIVGFMRPGMTEREVQIELEDFMRRHGAEGLAFPSIVAAGPNGASPHAVPGATRLESGQCVVLDFGARARGYCSDMTRTVFLGRPSERQRAAYEAIRSANEQVEAALKPGVTGKDMHELAERVLAEHGFAGRMGHGLGHGVGIDIHEEPNLSPRNPEPLVEGNVVTVEPGIYLPGEFGMRLEDFGAITHDGFAVFTQSTHDMVII